MIEEIEEISKREFGFMFGNRMVRRLSFYTQRELEDYINSHHPSDCYVSVAFYDFPVDMKGWKGAELFFDCDSKENIKIAYADALTIYDVLINDFGLKRIEMRFSGAKGYHVISFDKEPQILNRKAREQICDYIKRRYGVVTLDAPASCDVKRLRRICGSVNSKSGKRCDLIKTTMGVEMGKCR